MPRNADAGARRILGQMVLKFIICESVHGRWNEVST